MWWKSGKVKVVKKGGSAIYGIGGIGAFVHYMQNADTFTEVVIGILKSFVWPAFLIHRLFGFLGM
jgi:ABC-type transporter Mla maintaining outer membrane lipid asymmetry permease subunit MlaE